MNTISPLEPQAISWRAIDDFRISAERYGARPALRVAGVQLSYSALQHRADQIAAALARHETATSAPIVAIYASRQADTYAAVLACLMRGCCYVPLNPKFPAARNRTILDRSGAAVVLCGSEDEAAVEAILTAGTDTAAATRLCTAELPPAPGAQPARPHDNPNAYMLFTSGSTGQPKGVPIRHSNLAAYLEAVFQVADYTHQDRMSQNFDLTFDLSVHDMFVCWRAGAELIVPSATDLERPAQYIRDSGVTCWFSVPSLAQKMRLQDSITPQNIGGLRLTLFCGEALPADLALDWARATGQRVENWYGPTEATIACTRYALPTDPAQTKTRFGLVSIGIPLPGMQALVLTEDGTPAPAAECGELLIAGPQLAEGYLEDPDKTAQAFVSLPGYSQRFYRTGDRVESGSSGDLNFIDRIDNQIKIRGYRVELGEIEAALRARAPGHNAIVVPLPLKSASPSTLVAVIEGWDGNRKELLSQLAADLPDYMHPSRVLKMAQFPKNASGKVDRGEIGQRVTKRLQKQEAKTTPAKLGRYVKMAIAVQKINPGLLRRDIEQAPNLMEAGLDSLGFVEFTTWLEKQFDLAMDQHMVAELSQMSLRQILKVVQRAKDAGASRLHMASAPAESHKQTKRQLHYRAMRTLDMLDKFPQFVRQASDPLMLGLGSSGFMRSLDTHSLEQQAHDLGHRVTAANLGMGMLSALGITEMCEFVRDTLQAQSLRARVAILELEVMQMSILPPAGDIEVVAQYCSGTLQGAERKYYDADTTWEVKTGGMIPAAATAKQAKPANWEKQRNGEVRNAFKGEVSMDARAIDTWTRGALALAEVSDELVVVIHPIQIQNMATKRKRTSPNHFDALVKQVQAQTGARVLLDTDFDLVETDFKNINHMNDREGRARFSRQIVTQMLAGSGT